MSEHSNIFYLYAELMLPQQFGKTTGHETWLRFLGRTLNKDIQDTIQHVKGHSLEELPQTSYDKPTIYASCIAGKITLDVFF